jgi:nucleotide-binding universal stress UspA family protein
VIELANGDPAEEIVRLANLYTAELVVIGSRGLKGVDRVIQGSVSSQVLENVACSVLVVKAAAAIAP